MAYVVRKKIEVLDCAAGNTVSEYPDMKCLTARLAVGGHHPKLSLPICVYQFGGGVSNFFLRDVYWEAQQVAAVVRLLLADRRLQFVDIGANIGTYSLAAAHAGVRVVAVEPGCENRRRLARSICLGNIGQQVTVVRAAISNRRTSARLKNSAAAGNTGNAHLMMNASCGDKCGEVVETMLLNDLLPLLQRSSSSLSSDGRPAAILKIDIEGHEVQAFDPRTASNFFELIDVPVIYIEWHPRTPTNTNDGRHIVTDKDDLERMVTFLRLRGYVDEAGKDIDAHFRAGHHNFVMAQANLTTRNRS